MLTTERPRGPAGTHRRRQKGREGVALWGGAGRGGGGRNATGSRHRQVANSHNSGKVFTEC